MLYKSLWVNLLRKMHALSYQIEASAPPQSLSFSESAWNIEIINRSPVLNQAKIMSVMSVLHSNVYPRCLCSNSNALVLQLISSEIMTIDDSQNKLSSCHVYQFKIHMNIMHNISTIILQIYFLFLTWLSTSDSLWDLNQEPGPSRRW